MLIVRNAEKDATVNIFDLRGRLVKSLTAKQLPVKLDFPVGDYVVELRNATYRTCEKIQLVK
jgi:hypothetical protein